MSNIVRPITRSVVRAASRGAVYSYETTPPQAFLFNGTNGRIDTTYTPEWDTGDMNILIVSKAYNTRALGTSTGRVWGVNAGNNFFNFQSSNELRFRFNTSSNDNDLSPWVQNTWYTIENTIDLGTPETTSAITGFAPNSITPLAIGHTEAILSIGGPGTYFQGYIEYVKIYLASDLNFPSEPQHEWNANSGGVDDVGTAEDSDGTIVGGVTIVDAP